MRKSLISIIAATMISGGPNHVRALSPNVECSRVVDRGSVIRSEDFSADQITQLCRDFLKRYGPDRGLRRLLIATRQETLNSAMFHGTQRITVSAPGQPPSDWETSYSRTIAMIKYENLPQSPIARLIAVGDSALLTVRDGQRYTELVSFASLQRDCSAYRYL